MRFGNPADAAARSRSYRRCVDCIGRSEEKGAEMTYTGYKLKQIAVVMVLATIAVPATAMAGKPEAKQIASYLSGILPPQPTPVESGRAEAKQIASYLSGVVNPQPTQAQSSRAETKAFADFMRVTAGEPQAATYQTGGFDWGDAGVGAAAMLGVVLLLAGLAISRHSHRRGVTSA
jgi:hypothetical protein